MKTHRAFSLQEVLPLQTGWVLFDEEFFLLVCVGKIALSHVVLHLLFSGHLVVLWCILHSRDVVVDVLHFNPLVVHDVTQADLHKCSCEVLPVPLFLEAAGNNFVLPTSMDNVQFLFLWHLRYKLSSFFNY